jgi:hypothetical protein
MRSEGTSYSDLTRSGGCAGKHQVRDVRAGEKQDQTGSTKGEPQRTPYAADSIISHRL